MLLCLPKKSKSFSESNKERKITEKAESSTHFEKNRSSIPELVTQSETRIK
jgi:hypothetical protein